MPIAPQTMIDPLSAFMAGAFVAGTQNPCPLVATSFDVVLDGGLAVVAMTRKFRNGEAASIEATITFPVPVHAVLFALEVKVGERVLKARAKRKDAAREQYEEALGRGKTAVLHEEVLRGVHMLSVGHIASGAEVEVRATWAMTLTNLDGRGRLRIPLTVGDIYGRSRLADSDDLIHGGPQQTGTLTLDCREGTATLIGGSLQERGAEVALNAPIDIEVVGWSPRELKGAAADGSAVVLTIAPAAGGEAALDVAMIVDHSGSMAEGSTGGGVSKHDAARGAIAALAGQIGRADAVDVWEFDTRLRHVGSTREISLGDLARRLAGPEGGTEIGGALAGVLAGTQARDLLLVTDGKSHALDVQALARSGRRFSVLLVGADSLEAYVGHLAALTGGEIFVAAGADIAAMLDAALRSLRSLHVPAKLGSEMREHRAGMTLTARWSAGASADGAILARAVAALAASIRLPALSQEEAAKLAEAEGLVTHLTSLVLVDEDAATQTGIPATRKIALPTPATAALAAGAPAPAMARFGAPLGMFSSPAAAEERRFGAARYDAEERAVRAARERCSAEREATEALGRPRRSLFRWPDWFDGVNGAGPDADLGALGARVDWGLAPQRLQGGDLSTVAPELAQLIRDLARESFIVRAAEKLGCDPLVLVIALLARAASRRNRAARRVAQAILANRRTDELESRLARHLRAAAASVSP